MATRPSFGRTLTALLAGAVASFSDLDAQLTDVKGSKDSPLVKRYEGSTTLW